MLSLSRAHTRSPTFSFIFIYLLVDSSREKTKLELIAADHIEKKRKKSGNI
jgi:hypothetical protein